MLTRHAIREAAFQTLFAIDANPDADREMTYTAVLPEDEPIPSYLISLVDGVLAHKDELDQELSGHLKKGWSLGRLSKTSLVIMRLGLYEIQFESDLPDKAALNEAIELGKKFADTQTAGFINGILANFIRPAEAQA
ncbi:transcription antitermination factor NusB [Lacticaseibacillus hulanensis]|uniref:transcription antitermination factor NusB n=1 Tax=Lacticaseibacillus hulanensis TaxID=2493111 RepID=UPI000FD94327|nr:transcription antitermination factor NusB [Lacticaseibacillus hulanensis]